MAIPNIFNFLVPVTFAIDTNCDYFQYMEVGTEYYIYNQQYPKKYPAGTNCRWVAQSQENTRIIMTCPDVDIPPSEKCQSDYLTISQTGSITLDDGHKYCGYGSLNVVSDSNAIAIGLFSPWYSSGGRFTCSLTAIKSEESPVAPPTTTTPRPNNCDCGWRKPRRIVGGIETGINEFPYMGALIDLPLSDLYCGAAIISNRYALTAAHCILRKDASKIGLLVGDHDLSSGTETTSAALYTLDSVMQHPNYNNLTNQNDIAVVKTQNVMDFSVDVGPVCLPFKYTTRDFVGQTLTVLGWGTTEFSGPKSDYLQAVNVTVIDNQRCQNELPNNRIFNSQICTYEFEKDSCQYDSGGPLVWYMRAIRRDQLLGLVSYGVGCASAFPSVNIRVSSYLAWIVSVTNDATYCIK